MHTCSVLVLVERAAGMSDATSHISHALRVLLPFLVLPAPPPQPLRVELGPLQRRSHLSSLRFTRFGQ